MSQPPQLSPDGKFYWDGTTWVPTQYSPDGAWWWDGRGWVRVPQVTASLVPPNHQSGAQPEIGRWIDRRFEARFVMVRRFIRYLLFAAVLVIVFVTTWVGFERGSATAQLLIYRLIDVLPVLVVPSLASIGTTRVRVEEVVKASPERVFQLIVSPESWKLLSRDGRYQSIDSVESAASGGTRGRATITVLGLRRTISWEMLAYESPRRVVTLERTSWLGLPMIGLSSWLLEPEAGAVRVHLDLESRSMRLAFLSPLTRLLVRPQTQRVLARLKALAEAPTKDSSPVV